MEKGLKVGRNMGENGNRKLKKKKREKAKLKKNGTRKWVTEKMKKHEKEN